MRRFVLIGLTALLLAGCSWLPRAGPSGGELVAQANPDDKISFDVVKIDEGVVKALQPQREPAFPERFKAYAPPPDVKIAVGDIVSVVIWEASANGLFGNSLAEWPVPSGVASRLFGGETPGAGVFTNTGESATAFASETGLRLLGLLQQGETAAAAAPGTAAGATAGSTPLAATQQELPPSAAQSLASRADAQGFTAPGGVQALRPLGAEQSREASGLSDVGPFQAPPGLGPAEMATPTRTSTPSQRLPELAQNLAASGRPGTRIPDQQVGLDGGISIPYAGRVAAAGHTPAEVERIVEKRLGPKAIEPHAIVVIRRSVANSVTVEGEVVKGGRIPLSPGGERLLQVIAAAGGAGAPVHETFVQLSRGGTTATVPLAELVEHPDQDLFAEPGDVLTVIRRPQTFSAFGATGKNTAITFNSAKLSLAEALAKAGGLLDERADPRAVFLFRYEPAGIVRALGQPLATAAPEGLSPVVYRLDLSDAKSFSLAQQFPVHDKDVIFVANAELADVYKVFAMLQKLTGPVVTGLLTCQASAC